MAIGLNYFITCQGFPAVGMITVLIGAVTNIILDPIFIFLLDMKVAGAAIATVIAQFASCAFAFCFLIGKKVPIRITLLKKQSFSPVIVQKILTLGISPFNPCHRQCNYHCSKLGSAKIRRTFGGRYFNHLCHHCTELYDADYRSYAGNFQRYTGNFKL